MDNQMLSDTVSEQCRKYLMQITADGKAFYTIWFTDMTTVGEQDKLLIDDENRILVFLSVAALKDYVRAHGATFPDADNFGRWIDEYGADEPYTTYFVDKVRSSLLTFTRISVQDQDASLEQISIFNLIGDYRDQVHDVYLEEIMDEDSMQDFFDASYNYSFWETPEDQADPDIDPEKFRQLFNAMIDYFLGKFRVIA